MIVSPHSPVHYLNAVVQVGDARHTHRLGQSVVAADGEVEEGPQLGGVARLRRLPRILRVGVRVPEEVEQLVRDHVGGAEATVLVQGPHRITAADRAALCSLQHLPLRYVVSQE